ncbi:hypothetical protein CPB84DRAFT_1759590 [Gymnopilus junonius]|uniref:Uncharacterized protein n=1 Tax=Gymnopilus junonius TaxID=109634 RepID=A0A9P5TV27_GYMJU|nr:hypothetical protein CPB84DRAFT_1759590 [Gymnopilus junonius]
MDTLASGNRTPDMGAPPPYEHSPDSPLLLAETRTTRTVTTTTTETTTHFLSLPQWRKPNSSQAPAVQRSDADDTSLSLSSLAIKSPSPSLFLDKALPPTPPAEQADVDHVTTDMQDLATSAFTPTRPRPEFKLPTHKASAVTTALAHASLGLGFPHASIAFPRPEVNSIPFGSTSSPLSSPIISSSTVRRVKSLHRFQKSQSFEGHRDFDKAKGQAESERRQRGLSFTATSFLNLSTSETKGKGRESQELHVESESTKGVRRSLSRKASFWSRKKEPRQPETSNPVKETKGDSILILPPLPAVYQTSPFNISEFPNVPQKISENHSSSSAVLPNSYSENIRITECPSISNPISSLPCPNSPQPKPPDGTLDSLPPKVHISAAPRPRKQTSTPFLHRLSLAVFSSTDVPPTPSLSTGHSQLLACPTPRHTPQKQETPVPKPLDGDVESPEIYLARLRSTVTRAEVAGILASSSDPFFSRALRVYIDQFDFFDIPLDVALRKLLMEVGLPRETQQIDRVMEAFASRYMRCNLSIFISEDHPYILAFSLIMLHTDVFNPSNKRKMSKADYIKNTKLPGIPTEVLDCFFDNIVFAPFIFIEDPVDFNGQPGLLTDIKRPVSMAVNNHITVPSPSPSGSASFKVGNRIDPYFLILNNLLEPLRVDVGSYVPLENPFTYEGTDGAWNEQELHEAFVNAGVLEVEAPPDSRNTPTFSLNVIGKSGTSIGSSSKESFDLSRNEVETLNLKVTKVGHLNRKDDTVEGGRKSANRKWKTWSVILTGSQLLFFRDLNWPSALSHSSDFAEHSLPPLSSSFRPDESISLKDSIAVYDCLYTKYKNTFRFILPDGRQILLQAVDEKDINEWISRINYASTFKSTGVRMRPPGLSGEDALLTGVAAATSHLHDMQKHPDLPRPRSWDSNAPQDLMEMLSGPPPDRPRLSRRVTMTSSNTEFDPDVPVAPEIDGAEQFKATFDRVKAHLAADSLTLSNSEVPVAEVDSDITDSPLSSPRSFDSTNSRLPSRSHIIESKIHDLDSKIAASQTQLDCDLRLIRNIAILTPFQKSTRSRLAVVVQNIGKRVTQVRLELEKLKCHRVVLRCDLSSEGRSWNQSKRVALRVARETLRSRSRPTTAIPTMTLSSFDGSSTDLSPSAFNNATFSPNSSTSGSFHSALDFGLGWPSSDETSLLGRQHESVRLDVSSSALSLTSTHDAVKQYDIRQRSLSLTSSSPQLDSDRNDNEDEEIAEEWNRTRCAKRVSLIHVPSDIKMSVRSKASSKDSS